MPKLTKFLVAEEETDLTPLIDCVFLLLIFFMITTVFIVSKGISVDLPSSRKAEQQQASKDVNVIINSDNTIEVNGEQTPLDRLGSAVAEIKKRDLSKNAILEADRKVGHELVINVMDVLRQQGIEGVAFATRVKEHF
jgi:biopolymer transport protein ExbD